MNQADSLGFEEDLRAAGAVAVSPEAADLVVVNTCSVTATSDQGARQTIRRIARDNPDARIVVTGCYATRRPDEVASLPNVVRVVLNDDKPQLLSLVRASGCRQTPARQSTADRFGDGDGSCGAAIEPGVAGRTAFTLRVQTGCAEPCSYCIIPTTRGMPRSVPAGRRAARGRACRRGRLQGDRANRRASRFVRPRSDAALVARRLAARLCPGVRVAPTRSRSCFGSARSSRWTARGEIVDLVAGVGSLRASLPSAAAACEQSHARGACAGPTRSSNTRRWSTTSAPACRMRRSVRISSSVFRAKPTTTSIGLPAISKVHRSRTSHVFPYSDRPGTVASMLKGKVPGAIIRERARRVREIGSCARHAFPRSAGRHDPSRAHARRRVVGRDRELPQAANSAGPRRNEWVQVRVAVTSRRRAAERLTCADLRRSAGRRRRGCRGRGSFEPRRSGG